MNAWDIDPFYQLGTWTELWQEIRKFFRGEEKATDEMESECCAAECCA